MSILENFKPFNFNEGAAYVSVTSNGMTFNKSVIIKLQYPEYVEMCIRDSYSIFAGQARGRGGTQGMGTDAKLPARGHANGPDGAREAGAAPHAGGRATRRKDPPCGRVKG